jgi:hypothetical protein
VPSDASLAAGATPDTATTTPPDPTPNPSAVPELPSDFNQSPTSPSTGPADGAPIDAAAPPLNQAGHTSPKANKPALWATGLAFGALLLLSAAWLWARRRRYDPA